MSRSLWPALWLSLALLVPGWAGDPPPPAPKVESIKLWLNAPEGADWIDENGDLKLEALRGKVVVIKFWTTSCSGCRALRPRFNAMHADEELADVQVLSVTQLSQAQSLEDTRAYVAEHIEFPVAVMHMNDTVRNYGVSKLPFAVVIDKQGRLVWRGNPMKPEFEQALARARAEPAPQAD